MPHVVEAWRAGRSDDDDRLALALAGDDDDRRNGPGADHQRDGAERAGRSAGGRRRHALAAHQRQRAFRIP